MADTEDTAAVGESGVEASPSPEEAEALRAAQAQVIMEGLSRLERTVDNAGYAFTALDATDRSLVSLEALRGYTHVQFVNVARNQLTDVAVLGELPYLVAANLSENTLATPPAFANAYLQSLDVSTNQLTTMQGLTSASLTSLRINDNQLESLAGLGGLPSLTILEAARNSIADLAALAAETPSCKLERLNLNENKLLSLAGIEALSTLQSLSACQNNLDTMESIETLKSLEQLSELDLSLNPVADSDNYRLQMLITFPQLKKLDGQFISDDERLAAVDLKQQQLADAAAAAAAEANG